jgi:hypothetical protein
VVTIRTAASTLFLDSRVFPIFGVSMFEVIRELKNFSVFRETDRVTSQRKEEKRRGEERERLAP